MTYSYVTPDGRVVRRDFPMDPLPPRTIEVDGVTAKRCYRAESKGGKATKGWPMTCYASGVNAEQAQGLRDTFKKAGVPTEVTRDGDPVYRDAGHRKRALKARGMFDRNAFY